MMKKILLSLLFLLCFVSVSQSVIRTEPQYVAGKTSEDLIITSTTVDFYVTKMRFEAVGTYAIIKSSMAKDTNQEWYVFPTETDSLDSIEFYEPEIMKGTGKLIQIDLQTGTTVYYRIEGFKAR